MKSIHKDNPFSEKNKTPKVFVSSGKSAYELTKEVLSYFDLSKIYNKSILLKPNAGRMARPGEGVTTNPQVVAAAVDIFKDAGAHVAIGESPIVGVNTMDAFKITGIFDEAKKRDCELIDMDKRPFVNMPVPRGEVIDNLKVCADIFDFDYIISIPVMKMHMHTGVTLSVKNMKGCLWRRFKTQLHMLPQTDGQQDKPLNIAIADMASVLKPHLAIIDGTICMEGLGPSSGTPRKLGVVLAGADPFAADAVACALMGVNAYNIPHLRISAERKYGEINLEKIDVSPSDYRKLSMTFKPPPENLSIEFPNMQIHDKNSCSACQSTLLLLLKRYGKELFDYFPEGEDIQIAIGKGHQKLPEGTLCIGNCTSNIKRGNIFIKGCPPVPSEIMKILNESISPKEK